MRGKKYRKEFAFVPTTSIFERCNTEHALNLSSRDIWNDYVLSLWSTTCTKQQVFSKCLREEEACWFSTQRFSLSSAQAEERWWDWFHMLTVKPGEGERMAQAEKSFVSTPLTSNKSQMAYGWLNDSYQNSKQYNVCVRAPGWQSEHFFLLFILPVVWTSGCVSSSCSVYLDRNVCKTQTFYLLRSINTVSARTQVQFLHITKVWQLPVLSEGRESRHCHTAKGYVSQKQREISQILQV